MGVSTLKRSINLPDVPTIAEDGVAGYEMATWHTVSGPRAMPATVVFQLNQAIVGAIQTTEFRERFIVLGELGLPQK